MRKTKYTVKYTTAFKKDYKRAIKAVIKCFIFTFIPYSEIVSYIVGIVHRRTVWLRLVPP